MLGRLRERNEWKFFGVLPKADRPLAIVWWTVLVLRGVLPALFAVAMGVLVGAVQRKVARDFGLNEEWMNGEVGKQWTQGLPPGITEELTWQRYGGGLDVGLVGRRTLIALKLFAAVDRGPRSVHLQDLAALKPSEGELEEAATWVRTQDAAPEWMRLVDETVAHVDQSR